VPSKRKRWQDIAEEGFIGRHFYELSFQGILISGLKPS
jgi:hypothetical protein